MVEEKGVFGVSEWAAFSEGIQVGCEHDCVYCYQKEKMIRLKKVTPEQWKVPRPKKNIRRSYPPRSGITMFPTTHDITPLNIRECITQLKRMLFHCNKVLIVSKPHLQVIERLCAEFEDSKSQILFRFTIGSCHDEVLKFWEPNAPSFEERLACLRVAFERGFQTSVSAEPLLDSDALGLYASVQPYLTDCIWFGKMNEIERRVKTDGWTPEMLEQVERIKRMQTDEQIRRLYAEFSGLPKVKWKESIKKVVGLRVATQPGLDI